MTPPPAHDAAAIAEIAKGLTKAQSAVLLKGLHGRYTIATLMSLRRKGLVQQLVAHPGDNAWPATPLGLAVRASLAQSKGEE